MVNIKTWYWYTYALYIVHMCTLCLNVKNIDKIWTRHWISLKRKLTELSGEIMSKNTKTPDKRLFYKITLAQRLLLKFIDRETTNRFGVSVTQTTVLFYLMKNDGCQLNDLSTILMQNKSAITTLVERMKKNDLIVRKKSKTDGRASNLFLTDKGRDIGRRALPAIKKCNQELLKSFTDTEAETIHRFLDTIIKNNNWLVIYEYSIAIKIKRNIEYER